MANDIALIVIDMQLGVFTSPIIPPVTGDKQLLSHVIKLIAKARNASVPIIYVQHSGGPGHPLDQGSLGWNIHPEITPADQDVLIQKDTPDSFHNTNFRTNWSLEVSRGSSSPEYKLSFAWIQLAVGHLALVIK